VGLIVGDWPLPWVAQSPFVDAEPMGKSVASPCILGILSSYSYGALSL
jgi:hypothetical protein